MLIYNINSIKVFFIIEFLFVLLKLLIFIRREYRIRRFVNVFYSFMILLCILGNNLDKCIILVFGKYFVFYVVEFFMY